MELDSLGGELAVESGLGQRHHERSVMVEDARQHRALREGQASLADQDGTGAQGLTARQTEPALRRDAADPRSAWHRLHGDNEAILEPDLHVEGSIAVDGSLAERHAIAGAFLPLR